MPAIEIPDPLLPAIPLPCTVVEFAIEQHLKELGDSGLVASTGGPPCESARARTALPPQAPAHHEPR